MGLGAMYHRLVVAVALLIPVLVGSTYAAGSREMGNNKMDLMSSFELCLSKSANGAELRRGEQTAATFEFELIVPGTKVGIPLEGKNSAGKILLAEPDGVVVASAELSQTDDGPVVTTSKMFGDRPGRLQVRGEVSLASALPCFIGENVPDSHYLHLTSGSQPTAFFNGLYSPLDDTAVSFASDTHVLEPKKEIARFCLADPTNIKISLSLDHFKRKINQYYAPMDRRDFPCPPVGWLSWYCFFCDFDEAKALKIADFAAAHFRDYGFQYVQLETWEKNSWKLPVKTYFNSLEWDEQKFPHGMKYVADQIHKRKLKAGLWIVPLGTGEESDFRKDPEIFLRKADGTPVQSWSGYYSIDPTHPRAKKRISDMMRTVVADWDYDYVKVDGLELGGTAENHYYADSMYEQEHIRKLFCKQEPDPLRDVAHIIRNAIGQKTFFTACLGNPRKDGKFFGVANAARVSHDVFYEGEDIAWKPVLKVANGIQRSMHISNIAWFNDPDVLCVRSSLPKNMAIALSSMYGLTGQLLFLGDTLYDLPEDRVRMLTRLMPVENIFPGQIPAADPDSAAKDSAAPWASGPKNIWILHITRPYESWHVAGLFNWDNTQDKNIVVSAKHAGLDPAKDYLVYDYWNDQFLGRFSGERSFTVPKQSCMVIAIREDVRRPQILSTNRHITQGWEDLGNVGWNAGSHRLAGVSDVVGGDDYVIALHVPTGFQIESVSTDNGEIAHSQTGEVAKVTIRASKNVRVNWSVSFKVSSDSKGS